jgi:hypothetical protein
MAGKARQAGVSWRCHGVKGAAAAWQRLFRAGYLSVCCSMPGAKTLFIWMAFAAALVVGALGLQSLRELLRAIESPHWPQVIGSVRSSEVKRGCGRQRDSYEVDVHYDYSVNGLEYRSARVEFSRGYCGARAGAQQLADSFIPGAAVAVYVDPANPARAVLLAGKVDMLMYLRVILALVTVVGMLILPWRVRTGRLRVSW